MAVLLGEGGMTTQAPDSRAWGFIKSPFDLAGGLFLIALAVLGLAGGLTLPTGTLSAIGSGFMPRVVSIMVAAFGVLLIVQAMLFEGDSLERWHLRGPVFVLGAVFVFALVVRGSTLNFGGVLGIPLLGTVHVPQLGLVVAGPLAVVISSIAAKDTKPLEIGIFAVVMTLLSGILFKEVLNLPIPFDPAGLIPDLISNTYAGLKSGIAQVANFIKNAFGR
jgi:putative tricarboxylic transport membrane protein